MAKPFQEMGDRDIDELYSIYSAHEVFFVDIAGPSCFLTRPEFIDEFDGSRAWVWRERGRMCGYFYFYEIQRANRLANFHLALFEGCGPLVRARVDAIGAAVLTAARSLRLTRLQAAALPIEKRRIALLRTMGFKQEGVLRQQFFLRGRLYDLCMFALLEPSRHG
jgi:RimJ/RimL family protein N-acetyltransferase